MTRVLLSTDPPRGWTDDVIADIDGLTALSSSPPDLIVVDARLERDTWHQPVLDLLATAQESVALVWWKGNAGLFEARELIRHGLRLIRTLDEAEDRQVPAGGSTAVVRRASGEPDAEFITLLGTDASVESLRSLTRAIAAMRRDIVAPLWHLGPPTNKTKSFTPGKQMPSLEWLLTKAEDGTNQREFNKFAKHLDDHAKEFRVPPSALIVGSTGTGKTAMARQLHEALYPQDHAERPFVEVSAPTIRGDIFNDQFFGHTSDYSDATAVAGPAAQAAFGTLFIDEIGDLTSKGQKGLLAFLVNRRARFHGASQDVFLPVHIVAATNRPLEEMVREGGFRQDLYNRFSHVIEIRPLAERLAEAGEAEKVVTALLADPEHNPEVRHGPRRGEPAIQAVHEEVFALVRSLTFATGNFRELIDLLRLAVQNAIDERCPTLLDRHFKIPPEVVEGDTHSVGVAADLSELTARLGGGETLECTDPAALARAAGVPLLRTGDGRLTVLWRGVVWVDPKA